MKSHNGKKKWIPAMAAAKLLDVHYNTIRQWMKVDRVKYKIGKYENVTMALILTSSLKTAFDVKCKLCEKIIKTRKPEKTFFCCDEHRWAWHRLQKCKKLAVDR